MNLPEMPARIVKLPLDPRGYPIPWFVAELPDGSRDIRVADSSKRMKAVKRNLCWVCGETLGQFKAFVIGPMCAVTRTTSEPPMHLDCATWSCRACPFLTRPRMRRSERDLPDGSQEAPGIALDRNPGVAVLWVTKEFRTFGSGEGSGWLITVGDPVEVQWWAEGRRATRAECEASLASGLPALEKLASDESSSAVQVLRRYVVRAEALLPSERTP